MNIWESTVLTDKGTALQSKMINGQTLHITKVMTGGAKVPLVDLRQQTSVTDGGKEITLQPVRMEGNQMIVPVLLENTGLEEGYTLCQVGIYAQDPDEGEILYCLAQASEAKHIPSAAEGPGFSITWDFCFKISNMVPFEVDLNSKGLVSIEQYQVHTGEIHSLNETVGELGGRIEELKTDLNKTTTNSKNRFECGSVVVKGKSGEWSFVFVTFLHPHTNVPIVVASHASANVAQCACTVRIPTASGFYLGVYNTTVQTTFNWIAIEP